MPKYKNYINKHTKNGDIHTIENIVNMSFGDVARREKELESQYNQIGIPSDADMQNSSNVVFVHEYTRDDGTIVRAHWRSKPENNGTFEMNNNETNYINSNLNNLFSADTDAPSSIMLKGNIEYNEKSRKKVSELIDDIINKLKEPLKNKTNDIKLKLKTMANSLGKIKNISNKSINSLEYLSKQYLEKQKEYKNKTTKEINTKTYKPTTIGYNDAQGNWHDSMIKDNAVIDETWKYIAGVYPASRVAKDVAETIPYIVDNTNKTIKNIKRSKELDELQDKRKDWGIAYRKASGNPDLAIKTLLEKKQGFVPKAIHKDGIGDIDFVWGKGGKNGYGLAHIIDQRNSNGLNGVDFVKSLPKIIQEGKIIKTPSQKNVKFIKNGDDNAIIKLIWDEKERKWVVTSYRDYNAL